jgi:hypothetical protein
MATRYSRSYTQSDLEEDKEQKYSAIASKLSWNSNDTISMNNMVPIQIKFVD